MGCNKEKNIKDRIIKWNHDLPTNFYRKHYFEDEGQLELFPQSRWPVTTEMYLDWSLSEENRAEYGNAFAYALSVIDLPEEIMNLRSLEDFDEDEWKLKAYVAQVGADQVMREVVEIHKRFGKFLKELKKELKLPPDMEKKYAHYKTEFHAHKYHKFRYWIAKDGSVDCSYVTVTQSEIVNKLHFLGLSDDDIKSKLNNYVRWSSKTKNDDGTYNMQISFWNKNNITPLRFFGISLRHKAYGELNWDKLEEGRHFKIVKPSYGNEILVGPAAEHKHYGDKLKYYQSEDVGFTLKVERYYAESGKLEYDHKRTF